MAFLRISGEPAPAGLSLGRFDLTGDRVVIGRAEEAGLRLPDSRVSRVHVVLERDEGGWLASDRGSANGTTVGGRPLSTTVRLRTGMVLELAGYRLRYESETGDDRAPTSRDERRPVRLSTQERLALAWLCEPVRRHRGEFTEPARVRDICSAMHLAKSTVEKLLNSAQGKLLGPGQPLDRVRLAATARAAGIVTDDDLNALPPRLD
jgi:pSer/pThr/pTyr-binding forkhead associated (FHA) protein